jgi:hypothetical protein
MQELTPEMHHFGQIGGQIGAAILAAVCLTVGQQPLIIRHNPALLPGG